MKEIIFDSSPYFILLCVLTGAGLAGLLYYRAKYPWNKRLNQGLFIIRTVLVFFLCFLLLGPIARQVDTLSEKPVFVILQDNSLSVAEVVDSLSRQTVFSRLSDVKSLLEDRNFETVLLDFQGNQFEGQSFDGQSTNIHEALRKISGRYEGRRISGVILVTDGLYNVGLSPLYGDYNFPVYTVGIGDSSLRTDLAVKDVLYNKIAYQGNKFPLRVEISATGFNNDVVAVSLLQKGAVIERQTKTVREDGFIQTEFQALATEEGIQRWDVVVETKPGETNLKNNRASVFIEVVKGKKKILMVGRAPHPDVKALRATIEKNSNYELFIHIPFVNEVEPGQLQPNSVDLVIFHQVPDVRGSQTDLFQRFMTSKTPVLVILGHQSDLNQLSSHDLPVRFEQPPRHFDDVTPVLNPASSLFAFSSEGSTLFNDFPPVSVHFGKMQTSATGVPILFQKVGNLVTDKPLLVVENLNQRRLAIMLGEGLWRWRLQEYAKTESTIFFDEFFGKVIQFLSIAEDKSKFRSFPVKQEFSQTEAVVFESQVFNDIFEPVSGNTIDLDITDEQGKRTSYRYTTSPGNSRYSISSLKEGVYHYRGSTTVNGLREEVRGQFLVTGHQLELLNLTADFNLLRDLARNTGGRFYQAGQMDDLKRDLEKTEARGILRSSERYQPLIGLKWIFLLLLLLAGAEWFLRKYFGGY
jgi:hypothetical protein